MQECRGQRLHTQFPAQFCNSSVKCLNRFAKEELQAEKSKPRPQFFSPQAEAKLGLPLTTGRVAKSLPPSVAQAIELSISAMSSTKRRRASGSGTMHWVLRPQIW